MRSVMLLTAAATVAMMAACEAPQTQAPERSAANAWVMRQYSTIARDNAIIAQHTLYPYHFVQHSADLNELGLHDVGVLAGHFKTAQGVLNVRRGQEADDLYRQRIEAVADAMEDAGLERQRIHMSDGLPGGDGIASRDILRILAQQEKDDAG